MQPEQKNLRQHPSQRGQAESSVPQLPADMLVAIEGASDAIRRPIAEKVARALGAILVDEGQYVRSLKLSCVEAGVALDDSQAVSMHCAAVKIDLWVRNQGGFYDEALFFVNSDLFNASELSTVDDGTSNSTMRSTSLGMLRWVLDTMPEKRRAVITGRELNNFIFSTTPFRFFIFGEPKAGQQPSNPNPGQSSEAKSVHAVVIDGATMTTAQACERLLSELVPQHLRNEEWKKRSGPLLWDAVKVRPHLLDENP